MTRRRHPTIQLTDLSYVDDIALVSQEVGQAQQLLTSIETEVVNIGLQLNLKKTEVMKFNQTNPVKIRLNNCGNFTNFKYLGAWMASSQKYFEIRKALSWSAIHKMNTIWSSKIENSLKNKNLQSYNRTHIIIW